MQMQRLSDQTLNWLLLGSSFGAAVMASVSAIGGGQVPALLSPILAIPALLSIIEKNDRRAHAKWAANIRNAVSRFDALKNGKRWKGSESEVVYQSEPVPQDELGRRLETLIIGKTARSLWFQLVVLTDGVQVVDVAFSEVDGDSVEAYLFERDEAIYQRHFVPSQVA